MLVTFKSRAYANITMFGDDGLKLLESMGFGTSVPGAIDAGDVPRALENLRQALERLPQPAESVGDADDDQPAVSLHTRAIPLIELLEAAVAAETYVHWE